MRGIAKSFRWIKAIVAFNAKRGVCTKIWIMVYFRAAYIYNMQSK